MIGGLWGIQAWQSSPFRTISGFAVTACTCELALAQPMLPGPAPLLPRHGNTFNPVEPGGVGGRDVEPGGGGAGSGDHSADGNEVGRQVSSGPDAVGLAADAGPGEQVGVGQAENPEQRVDIQRIGARNVFGGIAHAVEVVIPVGVEQNDADSRTDLRCRRC